MNKAIFSRADATRYSIDGGECYLYPHSPTRRLSAALIEQEGRYPSAGYRKNAVCTEALFIVQGFFIITLNDKVSNLKPHDVVYIVPGTSYAIEGKGTVFVFIEPKWDSTQNTLTSS